jgi:hypothetical protein
MLFFTRYSNAWTGNWSNSATSGNTPALLMRMSSWPNASSAAYTQDSAWSCKAMSPVNPTAVPPTFVISATTSSTGSPGRPATKMDAPSLANFLLTTSPMPVPPPVTIATFPAIVLTMLVLYLSVVGDLAAGELVPPLITAQAFNARGYPLFGSKRTAYGTFATLSPPVKSARCASEKSQRSSLFC